MVARSYLLRETAESLLCLDQLQLQYLRAIFSGVLVWKHSSLPEVAKELQNEIRNTEN